MVYTTSEQGASELQEERIRHAHEVKELHGKSILSLLLPFNSITNPSSALNMTII